MVRKECCDSKNKRSIGLFTTRFRSHFCVFFLSGQYTGRRKPLPEYHVKIAGFDERVRNCFNITCYFDTYALHYYSKFPDFWVSRSSIMRKGLVFVSVFVLFFQVLVMSSIRKPKRLIIRGDDEKDHMFLVKGGEDLRLDQRIEQVSGRLSLFSP